MAKQKLEWKVQAEGNRLVATIKETQAVVTFDLTRLEGWDEFKPSLDKCEVARDSFYAGMYKKLAQPTGGSANPMSKWAEMMEALFASIVETNSYAQRRQAKETVAVSDLVAGIKAMLDAGTIDENTYQAMLSNIGEIRAGAKK